VIKRQYEMTISRADFLRLLPAAVGHTPFVAEGDVLRGGTDGGGRWQITLTSLEDLALGPVRLPRQRVDFAFNGCSAQQVEAFMRRFERHYQRAGG
jgi:hypothetical protein